MAAILKNISLPKDPFDFYLKCEHSQIIHWESNPHKRLPETITALVKDNIFVPKIKHFNALQSITHIFLHFLSVIIH